MLRARRGFGFSLAVSSGPGARHPAAAYARYALEPGRDQGAGPGPGGDQGPGRAAPGAARRAAPGRPGRPAQRGRVEAGKALVDAHSGALAAADGAWEALAAAYGVHRVQDLAEMADTLELFASRLGRCREPSSGHRDGARLRPGARARRGPGRRPRRPVRPAQRQDHGPAGRRDRPGLQPGNPLDVWATGRDTEPLFTECLSALAADPQVAAVARPSTWCPSSTATRPTRAPCSPSAARTTKPVAVLAGLPAAVDPVAAARLRAGGVPVLEGTRTGLLALRHLLDHAAPPAPPVPRAAPDPARRRRWARLAAGDLSGADLFGLLARLRHPGRPRPARPAPAPPPWPPRPRSATRS